MAEAAYSRSDLRSVLELQRFDSEISRLRAAIDRALKDPEVAAARTRAAEAADRHLDAKDRVAGLNHTVTWEEQEADSLRNEIKTIERKLYGGTVGSPKELEKMQDRVAQLRADLGKHEEAGLQAMLELEEAGPSLAEAAKTLAEANRARAEAEGKQRETVADLEGQIKALQPGRAEVEARVPASLRAKYERIRDTHGGIGASAIRKDGLCGACLVEVPRTLARAVLDGRLELCATCGRILIHVFEAAADPTAGEAES